jgi:hypothetical protein
MSVLGIAITKGLRNTLFISMVLHLFWLSFITFTFVDKINYSIDSPMVFLGAILEDSDISPNNRMAKSYLEFDFSSDFLSNENKSLKIHDYHLVAQKPQYHSQSLFVDVKPFAENIVIFPEFRFQKEVSNEENLQELKGSPEWQKNLKLKIE